MELESFFYHFKDDCNLNFFSRYISLWAEGRKRCSEAEEGNRLCRKTAGKLPENGDALAASASVAAVASSMLLHCAAARFIHLCRSDFEFLMLPLYMQRQPYLLRQMTRWETHKKRREIHEFKEHLKLKRYRNKKNQQVWQWRREQKRREFWGRLV